MRRPRILPEEAERFDHALAETPEGGEIAYDLPQPKWVFLHHLLGRGYLLHGSNEGAIDEFRTRATGDAHGRPIDAVFATDDAIWPLYFAVVRREGNTYGYINWCVHVRDESRYLFSIGRDPKSAEAWTEGTIYVLPGDTFRADAREPGAGQPRSGPAAGVATGRAERFPVPAADDGSRAGRDAVDRDPPGRAQAAPLSGRVSPQDGQLSGLSPRRRERAPITCVIQSM